MIVLDPKFPHLKFIIMPWIHSRQYLFQYKVAIIMLGLKMYHTPHFHNYSSMIAALPDMGNVAGIGMNFLVRKLKAKLFAEIFAYWPPYVNYSNGLIDYTQASYKFYSVDSKNMIIFTGDFNPADPIRLYEIAYEVIRMAEKLSINIIYSMGAALKQNMISTAIDNPIYIVSNNKSILERTKEYNNLITFTGQGQILGFNGLILGLATEQAIDALCLLGEIDNPNVIQPKTAQLILSVLTQILKIKLLDMSELEEEEKRKNFMQQQVNYFEKVIQEGKSPGIA